MRVTTPGAKCQSQGQPQFAHRATKLDYRACESARRRHVAHNGNSLATDTTLPMRVGRVLGLQPDAQNQSSGHRGQTLPMIRERTPQVAEKLEHAMLGEQQTGCFGRTSGSIQTMTRQGSGGERHRIQPGSQASGKHGWQYFASSISDVL